MSIINKWEKEVQQSLLDSEEAALKELERQYARALKDIGDKVKAFQADIDLLDAALQEEGLDENAKALLQSQRRSKVYQQNYQKALQGQVSGILDKMHGDTYATIERYLNGCYETGYIGTMYSIAGQGIPLVVPIDQAAAVKAVLTDSKVSGTLYGALGVDVAKLKKNITQEISRGIASSLPYRDIARNISNVSGAPLNRAKVIARTEGHRIQQTSTVDAQKAAKARGADVVKQWDAALDDRTRESHRIVDGEIRELDEKFSNGLMFPGDPDGGAAEVVNCRCTSDTRARWALDEEELETLKQRAEYFGLDKTDNFNDFKEKYLSSSLVMHTSNNIGEKATPYSQRGIEIEDRLSGYLCQIKSNGDYIERNAGEFKINDLAILTTETGVEYTTITIGEKAYLIRGAETHTTIPQALVDSLKANHGTIDAHSHPFIGDLIPSEEDKKLFEALPWQKDSVIIDPTQNAVKFTINGIVDSFSVETIRDDDYYSSMIWN